VELGEASMEDYDMKSNSFNKYITMGHNNHKRNLLLILRKLGIIRSFAWNLVMHDENFDVHCKRCRDNEIYLQSLNCKL
jgi:hypothetical protein